MYLTRLVPPFTGVMPRRGEEPGPQGAGPQIGALPNAASGWRPRAGAERSHPVAGRPGRPGALPRTHPGGEG